MLIVREGGGGELVGGFAIDHRRGGVLVLWWVGVVLRVVRGRVGVGGVGIGAVKREGEVSDRKPREEQREGTNCSESPP